jgi:hypothetical protein
MTSHTYTHTHTHEQHSTTHVVVIALFAQQKVFVEIVVEERIHNAVGNGGQAGAAVDVTDIDQLAERDGQLVWNL